MPTAQRANLTQPLFSVLSRSRASGLLLLAAIVMATVATTLVAAVPQYSAAIIEAGVRSTLADAGPTEGGFEIAFRSDAASWSSNVERLVDLTDRRLPGEQDAVLAARTGTFSLPVGTGADGWITSLAVFDSGDESLFVEVDTGRVPAGAAAARLHVDAAEVLGLAAGDTIVVDRQGADVELAVAAIVEPVDRFDRMWFDQPLFRDGVAVNGSFTELGPFFVEPGVLMAIGGEANYRWRVIPDPDSITSDDLTTLRRGVSGIDVDVIDGLEATNVRLTTTLPDLVRATDTAVGSTAAVVAAILLQLVGVALYGVGLAASVLVSSRMLETAMFRSRGATPEQLGVMAALEAALIAVPAVALGPWLGGRIVELVERWGPVAQTGLDLEPTISTTSVVAACIVGAVVVAIVTWPAVRSARGFARVQASRARPEGPLAMQRTGIDIGLAALAIFGLWQLRSSSAATNDLAGRLGTDPVLVFAPALGVVAASLLTLRLIAAVAAAAQRFTSSQGGLSSALAGWELARRPGRTARTSVLVVLAVTVGTFAAVHGASWQRSLTDQADAQVSADARVVPDVAATAEIAPEFFPAALGDLEQVGRVVPVGLPTSSISADLTAVPTVLTDARALPDVLRSRGDLIGPGQDASIFAELAAASDVDAIDLGVADGDLTIAYEMTAEPSEARGQIVLQAVLLDEFGTPVVVSGTGIPIDSVSGEVTFPLTAVGATGDRQRLSGAVRLIELELAAPSVQDIPNAEEPRLPAEFDVTFFDARVGDRPIELGTTWEVVSTTLYRPLEPPSVGIRAGARLAVSLTTGRTQVARTPFIVQIGTAAFGSLSGSEVPVAVTPGLLDVTELSIGDTISGRVPGAAVTYRIAAVVPSVPFAVDEDLAILADLETVNIDRWSRARRTEAVDEWAVTADAVDAEALERTLAGPPFSVMSFEHRVDTARTLSREPVTVGLSGSLGLALAASLVIATVGLILTAVVGGRERRPAFAVLRAMGVRASELRRWLVLETVPLVGLSAAVGLVAGILLVRLSLGSLAVARDGSPAVPGPVLAIPWATLSAILAVALVAGTALPVVTARLLRRHRTADDLRIGDTT